MVSKQNPEKDEKPLHCSRKAIFCNDHDSDPRLDTPAPQISQICACPEKLNNAILKRARFCSPKGFSPQNTIWLNNRASKETILKEGLQKRILEVQRREIAPKPLVLKLSHLCTSSTSPPWAETPPTKKMQPRKQRCAKFLKNGLFAKRPDFTTALLKTEMCKLQPPISHYKWFQKTRAAS